MPTPVAPVTPTTPVAPWTPVAPVTPAPVAPETPIAPVAPTGPVVPTGPLPPINFTSIGADLGSIRIGAADILILIGESLIMVVIVLLERKTVEL